MVFWSDFAGKLMNWMKYIAKRFGYMGNNMYLLAFGRYAYCASKKIQAGCQRERSVPPQNVSLPSELSCLRVIENSEFSGISHCQKLRKH
jgi:hypothetical protein